MLRYGLRQSVIFFLLLFQAAFCQNKSGALTISEIMFHPSAANSEYIEIYNTSSTDTIDLSGLAIQYQTSAPDTIFQTGAAALLLPESFAVIFEGDYEPATGIYKDLPAKGVLILKIRSTAFGSAGMSNSSDRTIVLTGLQKDTLDIHTYSADNDAGISDEKIILRLKNMPSNWANSLKKDGTPGRTNSVMLNAWKLKIDSVLINPEHPEHNEEVSFSAALCNTGFLAIFSIRLHCYYDTDKDSAGTGNELIDTAFFSVLEPGKSVRFSRTVGQLAYGIHRILLKGEYKNQNGDQFTFNYLYDFQVSRGSAKKYDIVINEIMYAPPSGEPEWIELTNRSASAIDIKKWKVADNVSKAYISSASRVLQPGDFLIVTADTSIKSFYNVTSDVVQINLPSLNNTGDVIILSDSLGSAIDSVAYSPLWGGNKGTSLERLSADLPSLFSSGWRSPDGNVKATPGGINSITPREYDLSINLVSCPEYIFTGEQADIFFKIKNTGMKRSPGFSVMIFCSTNTGSDVNTGDLIWEAGFPALESGDSSVIKAVLDKLEEGKNLFAVRVVPERDDRPENNQKFFAIAGIKINEVRGDLVINEIMYAPESGHCEWIELFNSSSKDILFCRYKAANHSDTAFLAIPPAVIHPSEYFVIFRDSSALSDYPAAGSFNISRFPQLGNQGDIVIVLDSLSRVIDSVKYSAQWGGSIGISLERINSKASSTDPLNWKPSAAKLKGTPGMKNSASPLDFDPELKRFYVSPQHPDLDDSVSFTAEIKNNGVKNCIFYTELLELDLKDSSITKSFDKGNSIELAPHDSIAWTFAFRLLPPLTEKLTAVRIVPVNDENIKNNSICLSIIPGIGKGVLLLNEIMYAPAGGEPEWIELFNSRNYPISIKGVRISDESVPQALYTVADIGITAGPKQFLVLAADSSFFSFHPSVNCPVVVTGLPAFNNDGDAVIIKDIKGVTIDSMYYTASWGGNSGYSLERISAGKISLIKDNWGQSRASGKSTPGRTNSLSKKDFDLELSGIVFEPSSAAVGEKTAVSAVIKNTGNFDAENFSAIAYAWEYDSGSEYQIGNLNNLSIRASDSLTVRFTSPFILRCSTMVTVKVISSIDQDSSNNQMSTVISPGYTRGIILINEVMHDPAGNEPEWIELINNSAHSVNLKDWTLSVSASRYRTAISDRDLIIKPGEMVVAARDSAVKSFYPGASFFQHTCRFRQLGNYSDIISLYDQKNTLIDSLSYKTGWHKIKGRSIERFSLDANTCDSCSWAPSLHRMKATPGSANSITALLGYKRNSLIINEILYNPAEGNSEFIELYNPGDGSIDIGGWQFYQKSGDYFTLSDSCRVIQPGSFFLLASDSSLFSNYSSLKNSSSCSICSNTLSLLKDGDRIILKDARGNVADSLFYYDKWHTKTESATKNISLERYSPHLDSNLPENWHSSYNSAGATPAAPNSIKPPQVNGRKGFSVSPNPFSPDNDGFEDITHIDIDTEDDVEAVKVRIYTGNGIPVRTLYSKAPGGHLTIDFDGRNEQGEALRIGIYILLIEKIKTDSMPSEAIKSVVVIARKL